MVSLETGVTNASADEGVAVMRKPAAVLFVLSLAVLALALIPAAGFAAKGGTHGAPSGSSGGAGGGGGASMSFDPQAVVVGQQYQVNVSGLSPNTWSNVGAYYIASDAAYWCSAMTDGAGNFSCAFTAEKAGSILHEAYQKGNNNRYRLKASAYLTVSP
jgi:hypothetical protein